MNWRQRRKVFLAALEVLEVSRNATASGMSRKLQELADFVDAGGKVQSGALFVNSERKSNHTWLDWAVDFVSCLPEDATQKTKVLAAYSAADEDRGHESWAVRTFWATVGARKLDVAGLAIARQM